MTEQQIQTRRIKELEEQGYYVIKLIKTNKNGIPDLVAIPPESGVLFSEVKRPNGVELRPKYIEVDSSYELDEGFVDGVMELAAHHRLRVLRQINSAIEELEYTDDDTMVAGGRVGSQVFYEFEYYNMEGWVPVLLDFRLVEVDDYLDMMVDNKLVIS